MRKRRRVPRRPRVWESWEVKRRRSRVGFRVLALKVGVGFVNRWDVYEMDRGSTY